MALYKVTVKRTVVIRGVRLEKGMSVEIASLSHPLSYRGAQEVSDAFQRIYGIDLKKGAAVSSGYLDIEKIN